MPKRTIVALMLGLALAIGGCGDRTGLLFPGDTQGSGGGDPAAPPADVAPMQAGASTVPSAPSCLAPAPTPTVVFASPTASLGHLAIDADAVYFTDPFSIKAVLVRVTKCDGQAQTLDDGSNSGGPAMSVAVVPPNVAWIALAGLGCQVFTVPALSSGGSRLLFSTTLTAADTVALDATRAYFSAGPGVQSVPLAGGVASLITPGDAFLVAVDDATIYASQTPPTGDALISAPKSGGTPTVLVSTANAMNLAVDDRYLYWVQWNDNGSNSSVMRVPKAGGAASVVVSGLTAPSNIAVDASHVYFTVGALPGATQAVMRVPKAGGAAETLYTGSATGALVVDARSVYWSAKNALMRLDK